ncbi:SAP domain-containing protein [Candidatus Poseidoniaceae archaeon]|nr:SAP domain-containing protein [Candidatus Poseidoniaceae archaeon]
MTVFYAEKTVAELKELLKEADLPVSGKKADLVARLEESNAATEEVPTSDSDEDRNDETNELEIVGIAVFPLSLSNIEKLYNRMWKESEVKYAKPSNIAWEFGKKINGLEINEWFPKFFRIQLDTELEVLETDYAESMTLSLKLSQPAGGVKLRIMHPYDIQFKDNPGWLDSIGIGDTERFEFDSNTHRSAFVLTILANNKADVRLLTEGNRSMLDNFPESIKNTISDIFDDYNSSKFQLFVQENIGSEFGWVV